MNTQGSSRKIFISYRRADAAGHAGRIYDSLSHAFGAGHIFMDISAIQPGESFASRIERTLEATGAVVVVIGPDWINTLNTRAGSGAGGPRDFVRAEVATALKKDILVIPVLVEGARMLEEKDLPEDLRMLAQRNALEVSDSRWNHDVSRLIDALAKAPGIEKAPPPDARGPLKKILGAMAAVMLAAAAVSAIYYLARPAKPEERPSASGPPSEPRILFHVNDYLLQDFLERLAAAVERHDWRMVLTLFQGSNFDTQRELGIDQPQYIAEGLGLHMVGNSLTKEDEKLEFSHLNAIRRIQLTSITGPDEQGLLTVFGEVTRMDGSRLKVEIPLKRTQTGSYELAPGVG